MGSGDSAGLDAAVTDEVQTATPERLSDALATREGTDAPARGALEALSMSIQELKARAASVAVYLHEHQDLLEQIKNL